MQQKISNSDYYKGYFGFSRSQRRAIIAISLIAAVIFFGLKFGFDNNETLVGGEPFVEAFSARELTVRDSANQQNFLPGSQPRHSAKPAIAKTNMELSFVSGELKPFDPNKASFEELRSLGLREKAAQNLVNYREKGGKFRKPEDLTKLYSLHPEEVAKLLPFVRIESQTTIHPEPRLVQSNPDFEKNHLPGQKSKPLPILIDVNVADSMTWTLLPGIGAKRASSIIHFREKLGGFASVEQVGETWGLPDSVFQEIKANLQWNEATMVQISLNEATEKQLKSHPLIGWQMAKIIVAYRNQHGFFQTVDDLLNIHVIRKDWLEKLRPYLKV